MTTGYSYDAFGELSQRGAADFLNDVTFTGSVSDKSSGLQYMNARYYQPSTGRFLTQDSYTGNPYDPWTQHLYSYCGNNPTNMTDPTGHSPFWAGVLTAVWGGAAIEPTPAGELIAGMITGLILCAGGVTTDEIVDCVSNLVSSTASSANKWATTEFSGPSVYTPKSFDIDWGEDGTIAANPPKAQSKPQEKAKDYATTDTATDTKEPPKGQVVYRVCGGDSPIVGRSWTPVNPFSVYDYRKKAGLPSGGDSGFNNTGEYLVTGILHNPVGVIVRPGIELDDNSGGLLEYYIPEPEPVLAHVAIISIDYITPHF